MPGGLRFNCKTSPFDFPFLLFACSRRFIDSRNLIVEKLPQRRYFVMDRVSHKKDDGQ